MQLGYSLIYDKSGEWKEKLIENHQIELNIRTSPKKAFADRFNIEKAIKDKGVKVLSVHCPADKRIDESKSIHDLKRIFALAKLLGAENVVLHPPNVDDDNTIADKRKELIAKLDFLENEFDVKPCLETFAGNSRIFSPQQIIDHNLYMVLDTSHLETIDSEKIIKRYLDRIITIHLSWRDLPGKGLHQRLNSWCVELVQYLFHENFKGNIILEYGKEIIDKIVFDYEYLLYKTKLEKAKTLEGRELISYLEELCKEIHDDYNITLGLGFAYLKFETLDDLLKASKYFQKAGELNCFSGMPFYYGGLCEIKISQLDESKKHEHIENAKQFFYKCKKICDLYNERIDQIMGLI